MPEEKINKTVSITNITVPLVLIFALFGFAAVSFWQKEKVEFILKYVTPLSNKVTEIQNDLNYWQDPTTRGKFRELHYDMVYFYFNEHGKLPDYDWLFRESLKYRQKNNFNYSQKNTTQ